MNSWGAAYYSSNPIPGRSPSRHVFLPGGNWDVACPGPISLPSSAIPPAVQGLLLRKENFEIGASYQLAPWQGWTEHASRTPPRTQVSDASGQLLKVNVEVSLTIYVGGTAIEYEFLLVKEVSVPLILGWDF